MEEREHVPDPVELYVDFMQKKYGKDFSFWWNHYRKLEGKKSEIWKKLEVKRTFFSGMDLEKYIAKETDHEKIKLWKIYKRIERKQNIGVNEYRKNL